MNPSNDIIENPNIFDQSEPDYLGLSEARSEEQSYFLNDALILIESFFRTISGIRDIRSYITIFRSEESQIFQLKDQKLLATPPTPLMNYLITEMMKSGSTLLFTDNSPKSAENIGKPSGSSWLIAPLMREHQIIGAIIVQGPRNGPYFSESDKQILASFTEPISNLFQNVLNLQSTRRALDIQYEAVNAIARIQEDLAKLTDKLLETLDVDLVLQTSVIELRDLFDLAEVEIRLVTD
jgi:hypothetical protein